MKMLQRATKEAILDRSEQILLKHVQVIDMFSPAPAGKVRRRITKGRRLPIRSA